MEASNRTNLGSWRCAVSVSALLTVAACGGGEENGQPDLPLTPGATGAFDAGSTSAPNPVVTGNPGAGSTSSPGTSVAVDAGSGGRPTTPAGGDANPLWCKAKAALDARCVACHDGKGTAGTPMGLAKYSDLTAAAPGHAGKKVWERVAVRIHAEKAKAEGLGAMPPKNDMTAEQIADLDAWIAASAPGSDGATCAAPVAPDGGILGPNGRPVSIWDPTQCDAIYKLTVHDASGGKLKVPASPQETYPKVDFDAPWGDEVVQVINTRPITDNGAVLHHWILYDKAGPFLTGWAPGDSERQPMPPDVGMKVPSGKASMYLDMHYYNRTGQEQMDQSGVELCVVKGKNLRKNPAGITMGFSQLLFTIPAGATNYTVHGECTIRANQPIHLMSASPHAHKLARRTVFNVKKKNGSMINMLDKPFVFGEQASYPFEKEVILETGDKVTTDCIMTNDTNAPVSFGESNDTEMCFNFASYYPVGAFCCEELGLQSCLTGGLTPAGGAGTTGGAGGLLGGLLGGFLGGP